ncbi:hypothetical protein LTR37_010293 [Vermiconidia calcicola]|uniref:Uncharacterized protein n=1 Tax=Vermiconidia calcicola TaxID=1690605 RepID=A0ACC3N6M1_9PEZI|nr:hypothetical protein LTR37_010293 [Vermiconidia calcicola]
MHELIEHGALRGLLHEARLRPRSGPLEILDVGSGTGKWAIWVAAAYNDAEVTTIDLLPITAVELQEYPNLHPKSPVDFTRDRWADLRVDSFDLVRLALLCGCVPDWPRLLSTAFKYLLPGVGQIELVEIDHTPRSAPEPFPIQSLVFVQWWEYLKEASNRAGLPMEYREDTERLLEDAGFVDISRKRIRCPYVGHPDDKHDQDTADWLANAVRSFEGDDERGVRDENMNAFVALSMFHFTTQFGWSEQLVKRLCNDVLQTTRPQTTCPREYPLYHYM